MIKELRDRAHQNERIDKINEISEALNWIVWALYNQQFNGLATDEKLTEYENFLKGMVDD